VSGLERTWLTRRIAPLSMSLAVFLLSLAFFVAASPTLSGDEPHYILYAKSIGRGWGLDLQRAYKPRSYRDFYDGQLEPHARRFTGPDGRLASWHGIGLPLLLVPFAVTDPPVWGFRLVMIAVTSALAYHLFMLVRSLTRAGPAVVGFGVAAVVLSPPTIYYAGQVYPELLAALLVVLALRCLQSERPPSMRFTCAAVAAALLPWLNLRYVTLTAGLGLAILVCTFRATEEHRKTQNVRVTEEHRRTRKVEAASSDASWLRRSKPGVGASWLPRGVRFRAAAACLRWPILAGALLGGALVALNIELFGAPLPAQELSGQYGPYYSVENLYVYGVGGFLGWPDGILALAPILIIALVAIPRSARWLGMVNTIGVTSIAAVYIGLNAYFGSPGWSIPGRYIVSVAPLLAVPLTVALTKAGRPTWLVVAVALALTVLSTIGSGRHFAELYTMERRNIQPFATTETVWPVTFVDRRPSKYIAEAPSIAHNVGHLEQMNSSRHLIAREGRDQPGALAFGPYIQLRPGRYTVNFELYLESGDDDSAAAQVEVSHAAGSVIAQRPVPFPSSASPITQTLEFQTEGMLPIEFRILFLGQGVVGIRTISVRLLDPFASRQYENERWKTVLWFLGLTALAVGWWQQGAGRTWIARAKTP
jgi:hypothetical protein